MRYTSNDTMFASFIIARLIFRSCNFAVSYKAPDQVIISVAFNSRQVLEDEVDHCKMIWEACEDTKN